MSLLHVDLPTEWCIGVNLASFVCEGANAENRSDDDDHDNGDDSNGTRASSSGKSTACRTDTPRTHKIDVLQFPYILVIYV